MLKKVLLAVLLIIAATLSLASCGDDSDEVKVEVSDDGYVVVNGNKTEHKVDTEDKITVSSDGYVVVNGKKTEHKVDTEDKITVSSDGYVVVNGKKTEHKVDNEDEITVDEEGYLVVNGVKTEYAVDYCNHEYEIVTTQPTCIESGCDTKTCKLCGKIVIANEQGAMGHDLPRYTIDGDYHYSECTRCDYATEKEMHVAGDDNLCVKCKTPISATAGIAYDLADDGTYAVVIGYNGTDTAVKIADTYKGVPVKEIYSEAFMFTSITSVVIPDSVTSIGDSAFQYCFSLTSVVIPDSVTSIGSSAFSSCDSLTSVVIPDSVTSIGYETFASCDNLTSVVIPDSVTSIGRRAFYSCDSLTSVVIPDSVTSIGYRAFYDCDDLTSVVIGDSVTSIGDEAFSSCYSLTSVGIGDSVTSIDSSAFSGCNSALYTEYEYGRYVGDGENPYAVLVEVMNKNLSTYTINPATRIIANSVFSKCERLANITIPNSVTSICDGAFYNCSSLTDVYITDIAAWCGISFKDYFGNPLHYAENFYLNGNLVTELVIPEGATAIGDYAFYGCDSLISVVIPDSVTSIGDYAFSSCYSLTSVVIGDSVTSIGSRAFSDCYRLTSVVIPDSVTSIGDCAFYNCNSLTDVYITDIAAWCGISFKDSNLLNYAENLYLNGNLVTELVIPEGVTAIGDYAFCFCSSLTSVVIPDSVTSIGDDAFDYCNSLTDVYITDIAAWCGISFKDSNLLHYAENFYLNGNLVTELVIPEGVTAIGDYAFSGCDNLTSVVIPDSVTSIGDYAFYGCYNLTSVVIGDSVTSIGYRAFYDCDDLTSVVIGDSVTSIGDEAFYYCYRLTSVVIPDSVTSIGDRAFRTCTSLTSIKYRGTKEQWNAITKGDSWNPYNNCTITYNYTGE